MTGLERFMSKNGNTDFSRLLPKVNSFYREPGPVEYFILSAQQRKTKQNKIFKKRKKKNQ